MYPLQPRCSPWMFRHTRFTACAGSRDWVRSHRGISHAHHDDASNSRKCRPLKRADVLGIRYCYPPVLVNSSDLCAVGTNLSTRIGIVWRRGKTNISRLLAPPEIPTAHESTCRLPYEIVEMIIAHVAHDTPALKACSLTCHSWYTAVVPHLHYTLILTRDILDITRRELRQLSKLHRRGLMPLMKEIRVEQWRERWFTPQAFSPRDLRYFSAFANVQTLRLQNLDISHFIPGVERYFGHFSPTLRSIRLTKPSCTPIQLSHFLSLFPNLDDIKIREIPTRLPNPTIPSTELVPFSTPTLRGRLVLRDFDWAATWTHFIASGGSLRFHYMDLHSIGGCTPVLFDACAETLETLRFYTWDYSGGG
jgi:hypothetical protein